MPASFYMPSGMFGTSAAGVSSGLTSPQDLMFGSGFGSGAMDSSIDPSLSNVDFKIPGVGAVGGLGSGFGLNVDTAKLGLTGLGTIGNLWAAFQAQKLARDQFNYTKTVGTANLVNQVKSYNTTLEDRSRSRAAVEGQDAATSQAYIDKNKLVSPL